MSVLKARSCRVLTYTRHHRLVDTGRWKGLHLDWDLNAKQMVCNATSAPQGAAGERLRFLKNNPTCPGYPTTANAFKTLDVHVGPTVSHRAAAGDRDAA